MSKVLKKSSSLHLKGDLLTAYARDRLSVLSNKKKQGIKRKMYNDRRIRESYINVI